MNIVSLKPFASLPLIFKKDAQSNQIFKIKNKGIKISMVQSKIK